MSDRGIEVNITTANAGNNVNVGPERGSLETIVISGTFTSGTLTLQAKRARDYADVTGAEFTSTGIYSNLTKNVTAYRVNVSSDFTGDVWLEIA